MKPDPRPDPVTSLPADDIPDRVDDFWSIGAIMAGIPFLSEAPEIRRAREEERAWRLERDRLRDLASDEQDDGDWRRKGMADEDW